MQGSIGGPRRDNLTHSLVPGKSVPLGKEPSPEDVGEAAALLAPSKAGNITGSSLLVPGGIDVQLVPPDCAV